MQKYVKTLRYLNCHMVLAFSNELVLPKESINDVTYMCTYRVIGPDSLKKIIFWDLV